MIPEKLKEGDEARIIALSKSPDIVWYTEPLKTIALRRFSEMGLKVTFGNFIHESKKFDESDTRHRIQDLHDAFRDPNVKLILPLIRGYNSLDILDVIDFTSIQAHPKILCGYSDITTLLNAVYAKCHLVTYYAPVFFSFGELEGLEYTIRYFKECLYNAAPYKIHASQKWSDDKWSEQQNNRNFIPNDGIFIINEGTAEGMSLGGTLSAFNLLSGSAFFPSLADSILFIEDEGLYTAEQFERNLTALLYQRDFAKVKGLLIGRFQKASHMSRDLLYKIIKSKKELAVIPVAADLDFGHTTPRFTFPIGGKVSITLHDGEGQIEVLQH